MKHRDATPPSLPSLCLYVPHRVLLHQGGADWGRMAIGVHRFFGLPTPTDEQLDGAVTTDDGNGQ